MNIKNILLNSSLDKAVFDSYFKDTAEQLRTYIVKELSTVNVNKVNKENGNFKGIYILWRGETAVYVGRAQKQMIYKRIANHRSANAQSSSFALHLIREKVASNLKCRDYLFARYGGTKGKTTKEVIKKLDEKTKNKVKNEISNMKCSWIKVCNSLHQAHLEIFFTVLLKTAPLNDIDNKEKFKKEGENYRYRYYNSFDTS